MTNLETDTTTVAAAVKRRSEKQRLARAASANQRRDRLKPPSVNT